MIRKLYKHLLIFFFLILMFVLLGACTAPTSNELIITHYWARTGLSGGTSAIYFKLQNPTNKDFDLISVQTDVAGMTEIHKTEMDANGVMKMIQQDKISLPKASTVEFKQGGLHIMLMDLKKDIKVGDNIELNLNFSPTYSIKISVPVKE